MAEAELSARSSPLRKFVKRAADVCADLLVLPLVGAYGFSVSLARGRKESIFQGYSHLVSLWPGTTGSILRRAFYRRTLRHCSRNCHIGFGTVFVSPAAEIGEHVYIGPNCMIGHVVIEEDVLIGSNVDLLGGRQAHHFARLDLPIRLQGGTTRRISVGRDVWIGNGATVSDDIGPQSIVALGSVVVHPVPPLTIVGGNPAREIKKREGGEEHPMDGSRDSIEV